MARRRNSTRSALYVRIPTVQAEALDRMAFEQKVPKQEIVAGLVANYVGVPDAQVVDGSAEELPVGHLSFRPRADSEVLTLEEAAELLRVEPAVVEELAESGELPGRRLGGEWRFARQAVVKWLAKGSAVSADV